MSRSLRRRVVVTGIGPVTPVGIGVQAFWEAMAAGRSGISAFEVPDVHVHSAGRVLDFDPTRWASQKELKRSDRPVHLALAAAQLAWDDAGAPQVEQARVGVIFGTGIGGIGATIEEHRTFIDRGSRLRTINPFLVPMIMPNAPSGHVTMRMGFMGPSYSVNSACATGAHALIDAYKQVRDADTDMCLAGGVEAAVLELTIGAFANMHALSRNPVPEKASRPFDKDRDGFVLSEGAAALIVEEAEHAVARGARVYAEIVGYGSSSDAYHIAAPEPTGMGAVLAMQACLDTAGEAPETVDYINAHGSSTQLNDSTETRAIKKLFGERAYSIPVSSTKSMTGHMLGAAGAVEVAVAALSVQTGVIPPTINYETPDEECDLDYVPNVARRADVRLALSNAFGFGGHNAVLALRRFDPASLD